MLYVDIQKIVKEVEERTGCNVTLTDVSEVTGVNRNILSKLNNKPAEGINTEHLSKVIEFFFHALRHSPQKPTITEGKKERPMSDKELMAWVFHKMCSMFPDDEGYRDRLPDSVRNSFMPSMYRPDDLWGMFEMAPKDKGSIDLKNDLMMVFSAKKKPDGEFEKVAGLPKKKSKRGRPASKLSKKLSSKSK